MKKDRIYLFSFCLLFLNPIYADIDSYFKKPITTSSSNYGETGIIEIPNARFMQPASMRFSYSSSYPYEYTSLTATPFEWMEATYRYAEIENRLYGPSSYSGNQSLKDKGFDFKFRLLKERNFLPQVALGLRDIAGTGAFSSEYIVGSKKIGNIDLSFGYGWGLLGREGSVANPFSSLSDNFKIRNALSSQGGTITFKNWFSGPTSLLGGIEYDLKKYGLKIKLEYDTTSPDLASNHLDVDSRFNIGLDYHFSDSLKFGTSFERGNQFRLNFRIEGNFLKDTVSKPKPKNVLKLSDEQQENIKADKRIFYSSLNKSLQDESIYIQGSTLSEDKAEVVVATSRFSSIPRTAGRTARIVSALSPDEVEEIEVHIMNGDLEVASISVDRKELDKANKNIIGSYELLENTKITSTAGNLKYLSTDFRPSIDYPSFTWTMSPAIKHQIGGPEGFYLGQLWWKTDTTIKFRRGLSLYNSIGLDIYNNFNDFVNLSQSTIPHVRSDIQQYLDQGKNNIQRLKLEYLGSINDDWYLRLEGGLLEEMFGGVGGEILYRPFNRDFEFGLTVHRVKQRGFKQRFSFRDYETTTGHLAMYYDLPNNISAQILVGKYLAGDKGATIDISRIFDSGFALGVFATKTNLSAAEFGEGSFDKGFYFAIPTKLFYSDYRTGMISFGLHPLTKDGGALLNQHNSLHSLLGDSYEGNIRHHWKDFLD